MKLSWVTLDRDRRRPDMTNDMTRAFRATDGYELETVDGLLLISKAGKTTAGSATFIVDGAVAEDDGEPTQPASPQAKGK